MSSIKKIKFNKSQFEQFEECINLTTFEIIGPSSCFV